MTIQTRGTAEAQLGASLVAQLPPLPVDTGALCTALAARYSSTWTPAIDTFMRANLARALTSSSMGLNSVWNQQPRNAAQLVANAVGVPLPAGI